MDLSDTARMKTADNKNDLAGYFDGMGYPSVLNRVFTPNSISGALRWQGIQPAELRSEFTHLDVGCGDGVGLCLIAAAYPQARFVGIDAMPEHIEIGREFARLHGIKNIELWCQTFEQFIKAPETEIDKFSYITAQGVIAWVSDKNRQFVYDIVAENLADNGAFTVGYNSQPGWQNKMSSQQVLLRFLGQQQNKTPVALVQTIDFLEAISATGAKSVPPIAIEIIKDLAEAMPHEYMMHEYLNECWQPLWFGEVAQELQKRGLGFATHAGFNRLRDDYSLRKNQRELLDGIDDIVQRQTAMDILQNMQFRTDIFTRTLLADDTTQTRSNIWLMANKGIADVDFNCLTPAGRLKFDNPAARDILKQVESGPKTFDSICLDSPHSYADVLNAVETLLVANCLDPVAEALQANPADKLNQFLIDYAVDKDKNFINGLVSKHGVITVKHADFSLLANKSTKRNREAAKKRFSL